MPNNPTGLFNNEYPYTDFHELNLSWVIKKIKELMTRLDLMEDWRKQHEKEYQQLKDLYDAVMSGDFPPSITNAFRDWFFKNALDLVGSMVKHVYFGLTDDGYFCAYIPDNWSELTFDTVMDYDDPLYGHLMLMYD